MKIGSLRHKVALCRAYDSITASDMVINDRTIAIPDLWADIAPVRGSLFLQNRAIMEGREAHSHFIVIRFAPNVDITAYAWVFEPRAQSGARWFKVLAVKEENEKGRWWRMECRLIEKGDVVAPTIKPVAEPSIFDPVAPKGF